jgi:hypothetical protein
MSSPLTGVLNRGGVVMIRAKSHHRRPDPLLLLAAIVLLGVLMTSAASAAELINFFPKSEAVYHPQSQDDGFMVASMGHTGGALNVSLTPPDEHQHSFPDDQGSVQKQEIFSPVFLFLRYPW